MIYERIKELCGKEGIAITALEKELGFGRGSLSKIDRNSPSSARLQMIADRLGVTTQYLLTGKNEAEKEPKGYFLSDETLEAAQFLAQNPDYKVVFDSVRKVKPEDLAFIKEMIDRTTK